MLRTLTFIALILFNLPTYSQEKKPVGAVAFYNLENLFDTEDDPTIDDEEFLPEGRNEWTPDKYALKLANMAAVIGGMVNGGPDIIGVSEIENRKVLVDLVSTLPLNDKNYQIIQFDSPDRRGVDVALLYKAGKYIPFEVKILPVIDSEDPDFKTRDILWVKGLYQKDTLHVVVNHWPSRRGGRGDQKRVLAASVLRRAVDSVQNVNPDSKIIIMGDLNDDPFNRSVRKTLKADYKNLDQSTLYNVGYPIFKQGYGSLFYDGAWNLFDQIIISQSLLDKNDGLTFMDETFTIFGPEIIREKEGMYKGAPFRTFVGGVFKGGFSDHFPVYIILGK